MRSKSTENLSLCFYFLLKLFLEDLKNMLPYQNLFSMIQLLQNSRPYLVD